MAESAQLLLLAAMLGFWVIVIRPARRQQSRVQRLQRSLAVGDRVVLSSGIFGTFVALEDGSGSRSRPAPWSRSPARSSSDAPTRSDHRAGGRHR